MAKKPTAKQRTILEAMASGGRITFTPERGWSFPGGMRWHKSTWDAMCDAGWITQAGTIGESWYEITDLGRTALSQNKSA